MTSPKISSSAGPRVLASSEWEAAARAELAATESQISIRQGELRSLANEVNDLQTKASAIRAGLIVVEQAREAELGAIDPEQEQQQLEGAE